MDILAECLSLSVPDKPCASPSVTGDKQLSVSEVVAEKPVVSDSGDNTTTTDKDILASN